MFLGFGNFNRESHEFQRILLSFWLLRLRNEVRARLERYSLIFLALLSAHPSCAFLSVVKRTRPSFI